MKEARLTAQERSRRKFLKQMAIIGLVTGIAPFSWHCNEKKSTLTYTGTGEGPYKVWEEMLAALETSPDHLEGRFKKLIADKDAKAMFDFVRDEIHLMPAKKTDLYRISTEMKYGTKAALRYGFATPREKAELLHEMYSKSGIPSKVVYEVIDFTPEQVASFFYRPVKRSFDPIVDEATRKRWAKELGTFNEESDRLKLVNRDNAAASKLADQLWTAFPDKEKIRSGKSNFLWDYYKHGTPTVQFEENGETKYAHLFDPSVPFGELKNKDNKIREARPVEISTDSVKMSLSFRTGLEPEIEKELVSGEWLTHELVGNRIGLSFQNGLSLEEKISTSVGDLRTFTPALTLQGFDLELPFMEERSFLGNTFTLDGNVIDVSGEQAKIDGKEIVSKPDENLQKQIATLDVDAEPGLFPLVKLKVTPANQSGEVIEGLSAASFNILDNNQPVKAILENNQRSPNILVMYDVSLSMPLEYRDQGMDNFLAQLETALLNNYPAATITKWPTDSSLYTWLQKASLTTNDLILFATDGDNDDKYDPAFDHIYRSGPPALILSVKDTSFDAFNKMAELTNGVVLNAKDKEATTKEIVSFLQKTTISPYVFTYYSSGQNIPHTVQISVDNKRLTASDDYKFKPSLEKDMPLGQRIAGLYLTITNGDKKVRRVLAGWNEYKKTPPVQKNFDEARNFILGGALISVEGEGPTLATALSDELKYKLSTRSWGEPLLRGEDDKAMEEFEKGGLHYDSLFIPMMGPLEDGVTKNSYTYAAGPRIAIIKQSIGIGQKESSTSFDYLPMSEYMSMDKDPVKAFKTTMEKTAQLAVLEKQYFERNTMDLLKDKPLLELTAASSQSWFRDNPAVEKDPGFWEHQVRLHHYGAKTTLYKPYTFFDQTASAKAYWQIAHDTGELYGILQDGTGGGVRSQETQLQEIDRVVEAYAKILDHMAKGMGGALPIVAIYSKTLVKLYAIASVAIVLMDASHVKKDVRKALISMANEVAKRISKM